LKKTILIGILLFGINSFSQIINTAPYILTVDQLKQWTSSGSTASTDLIATVNLAPRFTNIATQFNPSLSNDMKIAYLPDGMNNFGNYFVEQSQFNLYNFTHWAYIDKLVWFGGTASQTVQLPASPWVNAAHKNGVKVFGNVFFAPTAFGGSTATLTNFLEQDGNGNFVVVPRMIAMMQYYNFDGWFINEETATNATTALLMQDFVQELTTQAEALGKEVMWYDAMRLTGIVGWQNRLTALNSPFIQDDQDVNGTFETRVSSSIFINFSWNGTVFPTASRTRANLIGRSSFDVFTGVDIWPGRNQGNFETSGNTFMTNLHENATTPFTSLGIFAPNCIYNNSTFSNFNNDPTDFASFYNAENHLFSGDDNNPATVDVTGFKGLCNWIPETSVVSTLPFQTNFCTGHGTKKFSGGLESSSQSWHNMNEQDVLPTWQFAFSQNGLLTANWDFNNAYSKGNSLKISGILPADTTVDLMLYKTKLNTSGGAISIDLMYKSIANNPNLKVLIVYADEPNQKYELPITEGISVNGWKFGETFGLSPNFPGREIVNVGLRFESVTDILNYEINIGEINISEVFLSTTNQVKSNNYVTVSYPSNSNFGVLFNITWPTFNQIRYVVTDLQGKVVSKNNIDLKNTTTYSFPTNGLAKGTYIIKFSDESNRSEVQKIIIK
jgi:endo-beta-N-acetylglucosaminidase D